MESSGTFKAQLSNYVNIFNKSRMEKLSMYFKCDSGACDNTVWANGLAISSFPHNQLGKDFRFNIRTLHQMGDGKKRAERRSNGATTVAYSYFFYGINSISIQFPQYVSTIFLQYESQQVFNSASQLKLPDVSSFKLLMPSFVNIVLFFTKVSC